MDKEEFNSMVEKYKSELTKYLKKNKCPLEDESNNNENDKLTDNKEDSKETECSNSNVDEGTMTYKEFMDNNPKVGHLKVQSFCDDKVPLSGVRVRIKKNFSDGERVFFDGYTDENGNINDIMLPAPDNKIKKELEQNDCLHAVYDVETYHENYDTNCANNVNSFSHIESVYPINIVLPKNEENI